MQAKAMTLFSNLRARKVAAAKRHSSPTTQPASSNISPEPLHLFASPPASTFTATVPSDKLVLAPQPCPDGPISPLTLQHGFPLAPRPAFATLQSAPTIATTATKPGKKPDFAIPVLDVSLLCESRNFRSGRGTAITSRRGRKAQKVDDDEGGLVYQLRCYRLHTASGEGRMARFVDQWDGMVSPKTVPGANFAGLGCQRLDDQLFGAKQEFGLFGFEFGDEELVGDVPGLVPDSGVEVDIDDDEAKSKGSRKRSWEEYDADDEIDEDDLDVETWLDTKMESGDGEILYQMAKKAVEVMNC